MAGALISARTADERILAKSLAGMVFLRGHAHLENRRPRGELLIHLHERAGIGRFFLPNGEEGRSATWVPVARDATMSWAEDSFSYAERTVPRATPSWAARSCQEGRRAPGASTPLSMAALMPLRICSASGVFADRSSSRFSGLVMPRGTRFLCILGTFL